MKRHEKLSDVMEYIARIIEIRELSESLVIHPEKVEVAKQDITGKVKSLADWLNEEVND